METIDWFFWFVAVPGDAVRPWDQTDGQHLLHRTDGRWRGCLANVLEHMRLCRGK